MGLPESPGPPAEDERLHPSSLLFGAWPEIRRLLAPAVAALFLFRGAQPELWILPVIVPAVFAMAVLRYTFYRYRLADDDLIVRQGIVNRNERHVPYARIQNIDLVQNPLHRWLGVAEVRVETAGGEKPEAVMRVLSLEAVDRMRRHVFRERQRTAAGEAAAAEAPRAGEEPAGEVLLRLNAGEIVRYGLISNRGMVIVAALFGALWQFDLFERLGIDRIREELERFEPLGGALDPVATSALVLAVLIAAVVLLRVLSVVLALFRFHGFRLTLRGRDLRAESGLSTRVSKTIPLHRIQLATVQEGPLHRWFGRVTVQVETAGASGDEEGGRARRLHLAPILPRQRVEELLGRIVPGLELGRAPWRPIAPRAWVRLFRPKAVLIGLAAVLAGVAIHPWAALAGLPLLLLAWIHARLWAREAHWAVAGDFVLWRSGWWRRELVLTRHDKIQAVELHHSPFDRRHRMASVRVDTAGASGGGPGLDLRLLEATAARTLLNDLSTAAGRTTFHW